MKAIEISWTHPVTRQIFANAILTPWPVVIDSLRRHASVHLDVYRDATSLSAGNPPDTGADFAFDGGAYDAFFAAVVVNQADPIGMLIAYLIANRPELMSGKAVTL